jgi:hypothetical protein
MGLRKKNNPEMESSLLSNSNQPNLVVGTASLGGQINPLSRSIPKS